MQSVTTLLMITACSSVNSICNGLYLSKLFAYKIKAEPGFY